jgi:hypothetical protein
MGFTSLTDSGQILLHTRRESTWKVEIKPAIDVQDERRELASKLTGIREALSKYAPYEYCAGDFDAFGEWYTIRHDEYSCRKGVPINASKNVDHPLFGCDVELSERYQSKLDLLERLSDFIDCFKDPSTANGVFPLTTGGVLDSCIHDNK